MLVFHFKCGEYRVELTTSFMLCHDNSFSKFFKKRFSVLADFSFTHFCINLSGLDARAFCLQNQ